MAGTSKPHYFEIEVGNWEEAKKIFGFFDSSWVFRGQAKAEWILETSFDRECKKFIQAEAGEKRRKLEKELFTEFKSQVHHYFESRHLPNTDLDVLSLMQHHGTPTRLLDWSQSPYIATFFAIDPHDDEHKHDEEDFAAVWALDLKWCEEEAASAFNNQHGKGTINDIKEISSEKNKHFDKLFDQNEPCLVLPVYPHKINQRMITQQGVSLCVGNIKRSFIENLLALPFRIGSEYEPLLLKIMIPIRLHNTIVNELHMLNINNATLLPGIDNFCAFQKKNISVTKEKEDKKIRTKRTRDLYFTAYITYKITVNNKPGSLATVLTILDTWSINIESGILLEKEDTEKSEWIFDGRLTIQEGTDKLRDQLQIVWAN